MTATPTMEEPPAHLPVLRDTVVPFGPARSAGTMAALLLAPAIGAL